MLVSEQSCTIVLVRVGLPEQSLLYHSLCFKVTTIMARRLGSRVALMISTDRVKVSEPGFPVAAAERGQEVVASLHETFAVGRFSIIPTVVFHLSIPDSFEGSWQGCSLAQRCCLSGIFTSST